MLPWPNIFMINQHSRGSHDRHLAPEHTIIINHRNAHSKSSYSSAISLIATDTDAFRIQSVRANRPTYYPDLWYAGEDIEWQYLSVVANSKCCGFDGMKPGDSAGTSRYSEPPIQPAIHPSPRSELRGTRRILKRISYAHHPMWTGLRGDGVAVASRFFLPLP